jgi:hypothetical protein
MTFNNIFSLTPAQFTFLQSLPEPEYGRFYFYHGLKQCVDGEPYVSHFIFMDHASMGPPLSNAIDELQAGFATFTAVWQRTQQLLHGANLLLETAQYGRTIDKKWFAAYNRVAFQFLANKEAHKTLHNQNYTGHLVSLSIIDPVVIQKP